MEPTSEEGERIRRHSLRLAALTGSTVRCSRCGRRFDSPMLAGKVACKTPEGDQPCA